MEWLRSWLIGITSAAMLNAVASALMPKGAVRQIGKLTGGLILLLAVLQPLYQWEREEIAAAFRPYMEEGESYEAYDKKTGFELMKDIIETECAAYLQNKAKELGIECRIRVACGEEGKYPQPEQVYIYGQLKDDQRFRLAQVIQTELAIPEQAQVYLTESGEKS